jgi:hypothetical protein
MSAKLTLLALALAFTAGTAAAQPDPKKQPDDKKLVTKVYPVKQLLGERGKAGGLADTDAVIHMIFEAIPQLRDLKQGADGPQIVERDNGDLEIRATAKRHEEIKDLLTALERLQDLAIDVEAKVIELDTAAYEKLLKVLPKQGKGKPPVLFAVGEEVVGDPKPEDFEAPAAANKILKAGRVVQTSSGRFVNGVEATVSARRAVVTFSPLPAGEIAAGPVVGKADNPLFVKEGFGLVAVPVVSADRRFVRFKLTEQSTAVTAMRKRELGEIKGQKIVRQTLDTEDLGGTGSATVADGSTLLFRLAYAPKDKVWVVVLKPRIFIQAEEDELKKQEKK